MKLGIGITLVCAIIAACGSQNRSVRDGRTPTSRPTPSMEADGQPNEASKNPPEQDTPPIKRADDAIDFTKLSHGLYWFGRGGRFQKALPDQASNYYDPRKPTLIYVHGWQQGSVAMRTHESTVRMVVAEQQDLARPWLDKDWNVGFFLWTQFADDELLTAERKIWDASVMTWLDANGVRQAFPEKKSASTLFYEAYISALKNFQGPEIRLAGHSLGSQMASLLAKRLSDEVNVGGIERRLIPKRLILLDPFFSVAFKDYLMNQRNGDLIHSYASEFLPRTGMSLEIYRTSSLSLTPAGDAHLELIQLSAFRNVYTDGIFTLAQQAEKHVYAVAYYFLSFAVEPGIIPVGSAPQSVPLRCLSASSSQADIEAFMRSSWQVRSTDNLTPTPNDDACTLEAKGLI